MEDASEGRASPAAAETAAEAQAARASEAAAAEAEAAEALDNISKMIEVGAQRRDKERSSRRLSTSTLTSWDAEWGKKGAELTPESQRRVSMAV